MNKILALAFLVALTACGSGEPLPPIEGPWSAMNPSYWTPTEEELKYIQSLPEK